MKNMGINSDVLGFGLL